MKAGTSSLLGVLARTESCFIGSPRFPGIISWALSGRFQIHFVFPSFFQVSSRLLSTSPISTERFGASDGSSGWKWDKGGVGMGGKDQGNATESESATVKGSQS